MTTKRFVVADDQHRVIDRRITDLKRRLNQKGGSPLDPEGVARALQRIIEGDFGSGSVIVKPLGKGTRLPPNHYRVHMTYAPLPSLAALKKEFGKDNVSDIFDGRPWELYSSCVGMSRTPGERTFFLHDVGRDWEREEQIAWGLVQRSAVAPNGYRPATPEEEYEFQKAHPELLDYVALGSSALSGAFRYVARVRSLGGRRILGSGWIGDWFDAGHRVLFVAFLSNPAATSLCPLLRKERVLPAGIIKTPSSLRRRGGRG